MWSLSHTQCYPHALQQSLEDKMVERVRNVIKHDRKRMPSSASSPSEATKRSKLSPEARKKDSLLRRYPTRAQFTEDASSIESHLSSELEKGKPRDSVLLPLMKSTYPSRRLFSTMPLVASISWMSILLFDVKWVVRNGLFCHVWLIS